MNSAGRRQKSLPSLPQPLLHSRHVISSDVELPPCSAPLYFIHQGGCCDVAAGAVKEEVASHHRAVLPGLLSSPLRRRLKCKAISPSLLKHWATDEIKPKIISASGASCQNIEEFPCHTTVEAVVSCWETIQKTGSRWAAKASSGGGGGCQGKKPLLPLLSQL